MRFKISNDAMTARISLRVSEEDKAAITAQAELANLSVNDFMVRAALGHPISVKTDMHNVHELRHFIQMLREAYHAGIPAKDERLRPLLDAAVEALKRVISRPLQVK